MSSSPSRKRAASPENPDSAPKRARQLIEIDPDGDVILKVGQGEKMMDFRVSGEVISQASEYFDRALNGPFLETSTKVIQLKEDETQTVRDFCEIVHGKTKTLAGLGREKLLKLAEFADVRSCERGMAPHYAAMFDRLSMELVDEGRIRGSSYADRIYGWLHSAMCNLEVGEVIGIAALFQLDRLFWLMTRFCLLKAGQPLHSEGLNLEIKHVWFEGLPIRIPSFMCSRLRRDDETFERKLDRLRQWELQGFLRRLLPDALETWTSKPACYLRAAGILSLLLTFEGIGPHGLDIKDERSLGWWMDKVRFLPEEALHLGPWRRLLMDNKCSATALPCDCKDLLSKLLDAVPWQWRHLRGICLACYREGGPNYLCRDVEKGFRHKCVRCPGNGFSMDSDTHEDSKHDNDDNDDANEEGAMDNDSGDNE